MNLSEHVYRQRWYQGYSAYGHPHKIFEQLSSYLLGQGLSAQVPSLRAEKRVKSGPFYFFVGLETEVFGEMSEDLRDVLEQFPHCRSPLAEPLTLDQIKHFVSGELDVEHLGGKVGLHHLIEQGALEDPLNFADLDERTLEPVPDLAWEKLLYWLSSVGSGTWASFSVACSALGFAAPRWVWRSLKLLGHLETDFASQRWRINPAHAVQVAPDEWVLCGQRSPALLPELAVARGAQGRWSVQTLEGFKGLNAGQAPERLIEVLPDRDTWQRSLFSPQGLQYASLRRHHAGAFRKHTGPLERGFYQLFPAGASEPSHNLFWDDTVGCWQQGDWYGLRFLSLDQPWVRYNPARRTLAVAHDHRLPEQYERPLVLASGKLPLDYAGYWLYERLDIQTVARLASLLDLQVRYELSEGDAAPELHV